MRLSTKILGPIVFFLIFGSATTVGYSHNAFADSGSQTLVGTTSINVDPFGVQQFFPQKAGKQQIVMGNGDPNSIPGFGLDGGSTATSKTLGQFHYYTITPRIGNLTTGGTQLTMRINLNPAGSSGPQVNWMTAEKLGYMVSPDDIDEFEQTGYFRIQNATQNDNISLKQGGQHTDLDPTLAGSFGMEVSYSGNYGETATKELNQSKYEFFNDPVSLNTGSIVGKWIGVKEISRHTPNGQFYDAYVDLDPINFTTGLPKNNWQHLSSHLDDGKEIGMYAGHITSWGKKYFTYRIDNAPNIDFALLSVHHIYTGNGSNNAIQQNNGKLASHISGWGPAVSLVKFTGLTPGSSIDKVAINVFSAAGNIRYKVYQDNGAGGAASTLLAESNSFAVTAGATYNPLNTPAIVPPSGNVWVGFEPDSNAMDAYYSLTTAGAHTWDFHTFGSGPNPYVVSNSNQYEFWAGIEIMSSSSSTVPSSPTGLTPTAGNAHVSLSWTAPASNGGSVITGYNIYRGTTSGGEAVVPVASVSPLVTTYDNTGLTNGQQYFFTVTAVNSVGPSAASNEASATPVAVPDAPTGLTANTFSSTQINLSWTAPANTGGSPITGYTIERESPVGGGFSVLVANTATTTTTYSDTGLTTGTQYNYRVSAINSIGTSSPSNIASTIPPTLSIVSPSDNTSTTTPIVPVSGTASDNISVQYVQWKVDNGPVSTATGTTNWSFTTASLPVGSHTIWVNATDPAGNVATKHIVITITTITTGSIMNDTVSSAGLSTYSGRQIHAEYANGTSSALVGKNMNSILVKLKKVGAPTGTVQIGVFNPDLSVKQLFGTIDASTISTSYTKYAFALSAQQTYLIQSGDRIGIKFTGGDTANYVAIMTDKTNAFDSTNSYRTYYNTVWNKVLTGDLTMTLR